MARYNPKVQSLGNFWTRRAIFKIQTALESPRHYAHFGVRHVALRRAAPKLSRRKKKKWYNPGWYNPSTLNGRNFGSRNRIFDFFFSAESPSRALQFLFSRRSDTTTSKSARRYLNRSMSFWLTLLTETTQYAQVETRIFKIITKSVTRNFKSQYLRFQK